MSVKYYAVKQGRKPGVYETWDECKEQVDGYSGAIYKSFKSRIDAEEFAGIKSPMPKNPFADKVIKMDSAMEKKKAYAFVDGSYNSNTFVYGYGGFLRVEDEEYILQGHGSSYDMVTMQNVAGEILGAVAAVEKAVELGLKELDIYYDYLGIEMWATGKWKTNKEGTKLYKKYMQECGVKLNFIKVKGHSGIDGNEMADRLAKEAVGLI